MLKTFPIDEKGLRDAESISRLNDVPFGVLWSTDLIRLLYAVARHGPI